MPRTLDLSECQLIILTENFPGLDIFFFKVHTARPIEQVHLFLYFLYALSRADRILTLSRPTFDCVQTFILATHSFSGAEFSGSVPDPRNFMGGVKYN